FTVQAQSTSAGARSWAQVAGGTSSEGITMLDHIFLSVSDIARSIRFYEAALVPLGITARLDYDGKEGPPGHPDLKGFGANGRMFFWLREGVVQGQAIHIGFVAYSKAQVEAAYAAAMAHGAVD